MKRKFPLPLKIDCSGLGRKRTLELSQILRAHFRNVEIWEDELSASNPINRGHYEAAWHLFDLFGVKVA